jgi:hypothetical protein
MKRPIILYCAIAALTFYFFIVPHFEVTLGQQAADAKHSPVLLKLTITNLRPFPVLIDPNSFNCIGMTVWDKAGWVADSKEENCPPQQPAAGGYVIGPFGSEDFTAPIPLERFLPAAGGSYTGKVRWGGLESNAVSVAVTK